MGYYICLFILIYMGATSRLAGNGFGAKWGVSWLPEVAFAFPIGIGGSIIAREWLSLFFPTAQDAVFYASIAQIFISWIWAYLWMQTGHKDALPWDDDEAYKKFPPKDNRLTPLALWISSKTGISRQTEAYAWLFMGIKGFLITFPVGGLGAILWPAGYEIGSHARGRVERFGIDPHAISEVAAGIGAGIALIAGCGINYLIIALIKQYVA